MRKTYIYSFIVVLMLLFSCVDSTNQKENISKNEVLVLGTIHGNHLTDSVYNIPYLDKLIREINPDYILAEIPPDRMEEAMKGYKRDDSISEPRVLRFPEYVDVIFPLTKELDFKIIPTAGWTKPMADERSAKLRSISKDSSRIADWAAYVEANKRSDSIYQASGLIDNPYFIHTHTYDSIQDIALQTYNRLFNVELGLGGWENINIAHYWNIEKALEKYRYRGKRFLIVYGAGHKGWFLRELRKRDDIILLNMESFLKAIDKE
ncbi:hypothetical protein [uncultured Croceitalea sp.]|uniref:hypothetical protein n=1 Tax=uncultured Croceitalea sp. TaxID=1798908 RepID=UPI0033058621